MTIFEEAIAETLKDVGLSGKTHTVSSEWLAGKLYKTLFIGIAWGVLIGAVVMAIAIWGLS